MSVLGGVRGRQDREIVLKERAVKLNMVHFSFSETGKKYLQGSYLASLCSSFRNRGIFIMFDCIRGMSAHDHYKSREIDHWALLLHPWSAWCPQVASDSNCEYSQYLLGEGELQPQVPAVGRSKILTGAGSQHKVILLWIIIIFTGLL